MNYIKSENTSGMYKKNKDGYVLDCGRSREYEEKRWIYEHRPVTYGYFIKALCFRSIGQCRGCTNNRCAINGGN